LCGFCGFGSIFLKKLPKSVVLWFSDEFSVQTKNAREKSVVFVVFGLIFGIFEIF